MTKSNAYFTLYVIAAALAACVVGNPAWLSDKNNYLKEFTTHDMLPVLGVVLAITLASAAQLHLEFNKIEELAGRRFLRNSRSGVRKAAYVLIWLFFGAVLVMLVKSIVNVNERVEAICNSLAIFFLIFSIFILISITEAVFGIPVQGKVDHEEQK
jgi:hypothetical protein